MKSSFEKVNLPESFVLVRNGIYDVVGSVPETSTLTNGAKYRLLHVESGSKSNAREIYLFRLDAKSSPPIAIKQQIFTQLLASKDIQLGEYSSPSWMSDDDAEHPAKAIESREYRWAVIAPLVRNPDLTGIFLPSFRAKLINNRINAIRLDGMTFLEQELRQSTGRQYSVNELPKPTKKFLYDALYSYWKDGQVKNALLGKYANCGLRGRREPKIKKRGTPNILVRTKHDVNAQGVNVSQEHLLNIQYAYDTFKVKCHLSKADAYRRMQSTCYSTSVEKDGLIVREILPAEQYPTLDQFKYWCQSYERDYKVRVAAVGKQNFEQTKRQTSGRVTDGVNYPAEIFEIDASIANIWLVSRFNPHRLIGKPVVYFVVDRYSSMITGMHVAMEGPSWNAARLALFWTMRSKVDYCAHYGIAITADQWPCQEKPDMIVSDSGEMLSRAAAESLQNKLEIDSEFNAYGRPDRKPLVESRFRFVQGKTEWTAGSYKENAKKWKKETGRDPRNDAVFTLREFTKILILEVLDHNNNQPVKSRTYAMRKADVPPYRRNIYLWGLNNLRGAVRREDDSERLYRSLLPHRLASISRDGLYFDNAFYVPMNEDFRDLLSFARVRSIPVKVFFDPNYPREIWVEFEGREALQKWVWADHVTRSWENCRTEEIAEAIACDKIQAKINLTPERERNAEKQKISEGIEASAKKRKNETPGHKFKSDNYKGVMKARALEKDAARAENTPLAMDNLKVTQPVIAATPEPASFEIKPVSRRDKAAKHFIKKT